MPPTPAPTTHDEVVDIIRNALVVALPREWMTTEQAARYVGCSAQYLEIGRCKGNKGFPAYSKVRGLVRYRRRDLDTWLENARVGHDALSGAEG